MAWTILFHDAFETEFREMPEPLQDEHLAALAKEDKERRHGKKT